MEGVIFQTSLIAAFVAGMVALFAPCCITFLLPAYLGNVFKEKEKVLGMTFIFGLGIYAMLLPAVIGIALISRLVFDYHNVIYFTGGIVMLAVAVISLLGIKIPMPHLPGRDPQKTDVVSVFTTGVFSGITSACCAPVLIGVLTLTFLSTSFLGALLIGSFYVLGMVIPLLLIALFLDGKVPGVKVLRKKLTDVTIAGRKYTILTSNLIAAAIFFLTGWLILVLTGMGKLTMGETMWFTDLINSTGTYINQITGGGLLINIIFLLLMGGLLYFIARKVHNRK